MFWKKGEDFENLRMGGDEEAILLRKIKAKERNGLTEIRSQHLTLRVKVDFPYFGIISTNTLPLGDPDELIILAPLCIKHIKILTKIGQSNGCFRVKSLYQCLGINHQGLSRKYLHIQTDNNPMPDRQNNSRVTVS